MNVSEHRWVVDSIEEHAASIEIDGKERITLPLWFIPDGAREGDVLTVIHDRPAKSEQSMLAIRVDASATKKALDASAKQVKKTAPAQDAGGDIIL